jgi:hypothetical protein
MLLKFRLLPTLFVFILLSGIWGGVAWGSLSHDGQFWIPLYNRVALSEKFRGWFEVNPRFGDNISEIDQLLIRPAIGYQLTPSLSIWQGYAWITNYEPRFRDEHRLYQQVSYRRSFSSFRIFSRTRLEERFLQDAGGAAIRARQMLRADFPFDKDKIWGAVIYDELFVNLNTVRSGPEGGFDQNRFFVGIHRKVNDHLSFDFGYQNQTINTRGPNLADRMNHIILLQWFIDWGQLYGK